MRGRLLASIFGVFAVALSFASPAVAYTWGPCDVHVTLIEPANVGSISTVSTGAAAIYFMVDANVGTICSGSGTTQCAAGAAFLFWAPLYFGDASQANEDLRQMANTKAVLSTLQMGVATGLKVRLYGFNAASGMCQVSNVNSLNY